MLERRSTTDDQRGIRRQRLYIGKQRALELHRFRGVFHYQVSLGNRIGQRSAHLGLARRRAQCRHSGRHPLGKIITRRLTGIERADLKPPGEKIGGPGDTNGAAANDGDSLHADFRHDEAPCSWLRRADCHAQAYKANNPMTPTRPGSAAGQIASTPTTDNNDTSSQRTPNRRAPPSTPANASTKASARTAAMVISQPSPRPTSAG